MAAPCVRLQQRIPAEGIESPVIIRSNEWGKACHSPAQPPRQAVQSNMVYQLREVFLVLISIAAQQINASLCRSPKQHAIVAAIEVEQVRGGASCELITRIEQTIQATLARICGGITSESFGKNT